MSESKGFPCSAARVIAAFLWLACTTWQPASAIARDVEQFRAKVIGVADGDTITVLHVDERHNAKTPRRIRISGIDAPEKAQPFGAVAKEAMSRLAFGQVAHLDCRAGDRYGRSVCLVRVADIDVGLRMIDLGLAWHYKRYASSQAREEAASYAAAEKAARMRKAGLWGDLATAMEPTPPWDWRKAAVN